MHTKKKKKKSILSSKKVKLFGKRKPQNKVQTPEQPTEVQQWPGACLDWLTQVDAGLGSSAHHRGVDVLILILLTLRLAAVGVVVKQGDGCDLPPAHQPGGGDGSAELERHKGETGGWTGEATVWKDR